jgi:hypothetical protein
MAQRPFFRVGRAEPFLLILHCRNNQLIVGAGVVLAILCYVGFLLFGGVKPLARGTAFRLR